MAGAAFGDELRRLRREAKKSLADLADALGCSIAFVSDVERGNKNPPDAGGIRKLLATVGRPDKLGEMLVLAAQARKTIEIKVKGKSQEEASILVALARRSDEGRLDAATLEKIRKALAEDDNK